MPLMVGGDLKVQLKRRKASSNFNENEIKFYITQVILGLSELHRNQILHRDLKLQNLMINDKGFLKIIDFGIARLLRQNELASTGCGTLEYMAPEVIKHESYNYTADLWSIGILMFEMRFGFTPFRSNNKQIIEESIRLGEINWPNKARFDRSDEFDAVIAKLLVLDRHERPQSCEELLADEWFPRGEQLEAIRNQSDDIKNILADWGDMPPFTPPNLGNEVDENYLELFDLKQGRNALNETQLNDTQRQQIEAEQDLFVQFETRLDIPQNGTTE